MLAAFVMPELELDEGEAKELTAALAEVNSFYSQAVDPKVIAWMGLIGVAGKIYGPRVGAFMLRRKIEAATKAPRIAPLAGNQPRQSAPTPTPQPTRQATPTGSAIPPSVMKAFSDPSFVTDLSE